MEAHGHFAGRIGTRRSGSAPSSRRTSVLVAVLSAVLAGFLIYMFVSHARGNSTAPPAEVTVYEATGYIPAGTPQSLVAKEGLIKAIQVPASAAAIGAISDPAAIAGEVVAAPIASGQQVTAADFSHTNVTIGSYLSGDERAVAFSFDANHGLTAYLQQGDTVDVIAATGTKTEMVAQDVTVLANASGNVVLRLSDRQSLAIIGASGVSTLWLELRPVTGSKSSVKVGTVETL